MATVERKYKGTLTLGTLEIACEAEEQSFGNIVKLEAVGGMTRITSYNVCYTKLLRCGEGGGIPPIFGRIASEFRVGKAVSS